MIQSGYSQSELFRQLVAHRLLALDAIRLLQRRDVVPAERLAALRGDAAGVGDQPVDERHLRAVQLRFRDERRLHVFRHEDLRGNAGAGRIGRHRVRGVARRRHRQRRGAERFRARHGRGLSARLERVGRVQRFVFDVEPRQPELRAETRRVQQRREAFTERDRRFAREDGHHLGVAPHRSHAIAQRLARPRARGREVVAREQRHRARGAEVMRLPRVERTRAARHGAFEMAEVHDRVR